MPEMEFKEIAKRMEKIIDGLNGDLEAPIEIRDAEEKGRSVFAIPSRVYIHVCEYKTTKVYETADFITNV